MRARPGLPIVFGYILLKKAKVYDRETRGTNAALAGYVAKDLKVDGLAAEFVIRDVIIGEDYSFLMDACALRPVARRRVVHVCDGVCLWADSSRYLYWEGAFICPSNVVLDRSNRYAP